MKTKDKKTDAVRIEIDQSGNIFVIDDIHNLKIQAADGDVAKKIFTLIKNYSGT